MMDASNTKWKGKNPDSLNSQSPYPNRYDYLLDAGEPAIDEQQEEEEMDEGDLAAVKETEAGIDNPAAEQDRPVDKPNEEMPEDPVVNPHHAAIEEAVRNSGYSKERLNPVIDQLKAWHDGLGGEQATLEGLKKIGMKGRQTGGAPAKLIIAALSSMWDMTPREIEAIEGALGDEEEDEVGIGEPSIDDDEPPIDDDEPPIDDDEPPIDDDEPHQISTKNQGIIDRAKAKDKAKRQKAWEAQGGQEARDAELAAEKKAKKKKGGDSNVGKKKGPPPKQEKKKTVIDNKDDFISSSDAVDSAWDYLSLLKGR